MIAGRVTLRPLESPQSAHGTVRAEVRIRNSHRETDASGIIFVPGDAFIGLADEARQQRLMRWLARGIRNHAGLHAVMPRTGDEQNAPTPFGLMGRAIGCSQNVFVHADDHDGQSHFWRWADVDALDMDELVRASQAEGEAQSLDQGMAPSIGTGGERPRM